MHASFTASPRRQVIALGLLLAAMPLAQANPTAVLQRSLPASEARKWLLRIHAAAHENNYQGTLVF
ncbi:MAG TPA: hypothetical protein VET87_05090, partial [Rubrivivax sp.]|nr:hypothetical protein [Rubrivivax sp.]